MAIDFPNSPSINDTYTVDSRTWVWTGTAWRIVTASVGPTGPTGPAGYEGSDGPTGPAGEDGKFFTGSTPPSTPTEGDAWYNSDSGRLYVYYDSYWVEASAPIAGPTGPAGADGTIGVDGATGPTGPSGDLTRTIRTVSTSTTLLSTDENQMIRFTGTSAQTLTIPDVLTPGSSVAVIQDNSGLVSFASSGSVNLLSPFGTFDAIGQNSVVNIICVDANEYRLTGDLVAITPFTATGGTITTSGEYTIHTFSSSGTFEVTSAPDGAEIEYLVVAGGGGGGAAIASNDCGGGGGGAGGMLSGTMTVMPQSYIITVGAGGPGLPASASSTVAKGGDSTLDTVTAYGGGVGGNRNGVSPTSGGSGGGGCCDGSGPAAGTAGQGNAGGGGAGTPAGASYGGGGAGSTGYAYASSGSGGNGGLGLASSITGSSLFYAGGGGGGQGGGGVPGVGGSGVGGNGATASGGTPTAGMQNRGGGGGGGGGFPGPGGASGGSGVVIVRYLTTA
jgi:hypothetical protein